MNHDNIIANQLAGMSLEEAIFQHGYSSGYERGKREATAPRLPKPFIAKFVRIEGIMSIAAWHKDHERFVDDAGDFHPADQVEWLDEQPAAGREEDAVAFAEELWDNHSVLIGEDIFTLEQYANREVMKKDDFMKAIAAFKQHNP